MVSAYRSVEPRDREANACLHPGTGGSPAMSLPRLHEMGLPAKVWSSLRPCRNKAWRQQEVEPSSSIASNGEICQAETSLVTAGLPTVRASKGWVCTYKIRYSAADPFRLLDQQASIGSSYARSYVPDCSRGIKEAFGFRNRQVACRIYGVNLYCSLLRFPADCEVRWVSPREELSLKTAVDSKSYWLILPTTSDWSKNENVT